MTVNFRTHPFHSCRRICFDNISLLKDQMDKRNDEDTQLLLHISPHRLSDGVTFSPFLRLTLSVTKISLINKQAIKVFPVPVPKTAIVFSRLARSYNST